ncbi:MAG: NAD(P)H-dependent oxidoreductase [Sphaerochaeta associata]|uniref:NAD(P)H-dependent oxidoreductase n=1 Tax=Sphaerochaeta associata TaxID=1129264 RepID=UPI002B1FC448|nr:NAD(P)H-dependent oxidoreductase [Sphaerochaeta associata]MEA5027416.1 NAD(P)H-dependent oxidoreductase [Sphaerochaeta associata]
MGEATKVVIVNASPKDEYSLTLQYARYLVTREPNIDWSIIHVGEQLTDMEYDKAWFAESLVLLEQCEAIIWATPVYTMLVPWQLIRYFELVRQAGRNSVFKEKYATCVMSCFHYFDNLAEQWLYGTCEDLGMHFMEGFSVDNIDLLKADFRSSMRFFMQEFHQATLNRTVMIRRSNVLKDVSSPVFKPTLGDAATAKKKDIRTVLLTDEQNSDSNLSAMIKVFLAAYPNEVEVVDINDFPYEGACQGCLKCELAGPCDRKDGFQDFYQNLVNTCDVLVHAMNIEGRYVKPIWKLFLDRTFSNGHRTSMMGKHTCYLVAGPLSQLSNVKEFLEGKDRVGKENSMGVISDECPDSAHLQVLIEQLAVRLDRASRAKYQKGVNFLGVGGMKIFRDLIYGMRGVVRDDHRFYKKRKLYDFPQKNLKNQLFNLFMGVATTFKFVRIGAYQNMKPLYILEHKRLVDSDRL